MTEMYRVLDGRAWWDGLIMQVVELRKTPKWWVVESYSMPSAGGIYKGKVLAKEDIKHLGLQSSPYEAVRAFLIKHEAEAEYHLRMAKAAKKLADMVHEVEKRGLISYLAATDEGTTGPVSRYAFDGQIMQAMKGKVVNTHE